MRSTLGCFELVACAIFVVCVTVFGASRTAEAAAPRAMAEMHMLRDWQPGPGETVRRRPAQAAVETQEGLVKGVKVLGVNEYLGIPYAAPPVGDLRWTPPRRHTRWHGVLETTQPGSPCAQPGFGSEDCLFLNVYTPELRVNHEKVDDREARRLPVMVWIHGGSLVTGSGDIYDPSPLVMKGRVIVVTINYRLGVLGFFAHPALVAEGDLNANYGLMDQQFALRWVKRNIASFGGDPKRVTIFGESAGGLSVYSNLASPTAAGLFQRAIAESGAYTSFQDYQQGIVSLSEAEASGVDFAASVGCVSQTAHCLRMTSVNALIGAEPGLVNPVVDGVVLTQPPGAAFASGQFNRVPVITGTNHDEYRLFVAIAYDYAGQSLTDSQYPTVIGDVFCQASPLAAAVLVSYPLSNYPGPAAPQALAAWFTDLSFSCPARNAAQSLSSYVPTYAYEFNDENAPLSFGLPPASFPLGSYHAAEIQYLVNIFGAPAPFTSDQQRLSDTMIAYWAQFAATGNPNVRTAPNWRPFNAQTDRVLSLIPPTPTVKSDFDVDHQCSSLWNTF